ncbi:3'-5' exonuclease [Paenibacillus larvae]|uniref:DNA polymerase III PolC-like protein n=5 Tax=Paenibacillus larvae TaxID=1464 RepID=V9WEC6_9BACL|nr:3'-5' exonuclease [Paenibacillus larvae]AHD07457.1 DNA polymerase III PolC-like protein [Paenibacillus larvae subsp. larvae DSM 25430]AQZ47439.1 DNA polymerase III subunit epsilon [Paenibacillus larvae subsp. pulvifaciens]ARF68751.1 DNA polymerase III subunit epsilon [Paenibacillus larvae subsp. pulvifaciens]AVF23798.1 DNA polymerase III PolC-like protein [Paenibacillus larvae subsp. larvae]AVF24785.1 DNA polymerase III PolC-like protein [Paenibacillus larvae subsp. larvae]
MAKKLQLLKHAPRNWLLGQRSKQLYQGICDYCRERVFIEKTSENALEFIRSWIKSKYLILDTETTGIEYDSEIVDIAIIDLDKNLIFASLVKPICPIPEEATMIHGITNEMVADAPSWLEVWAQVQKLLSGKTLLIYNADFD